MSPLLKHFKTAALVTVALLSGGLQAADEWVTGTVRRIDPEQQKMTVQHEEIKSLQMPPMRMVFRVNSPDLAQGISVGDKIEFVTAEQSGTYVILKLRKP